MTGKARRLVEGAAALPLLLAQAVALGGGEVSLEAVLPPEREVEVLVDGPSVADRPLVTALVLGWLPRDAALPAFGVSLGEPSDVGGLSILTGAYTIDGLPVVRSSFTLVAAPGGRVVAASRPRFAPADLVAYPGGALLGLQEGERISRGHLPPGFRLRTLGPAYWVEARRWILASAGAAGGEIAVPPSAEGWEALTVVLDARSGELLGTGRLGVEIEVRGLCWGSALPLEGSAVRRAYGAENENTGLEGVISRLTLELADPDGTVIAEGPSGSDGRFQLLAPPTPVWTLAPRARSDEVTMIFAGESLRFGEPLRGRGDGALVVELTPNIPVDPADLVRESLLGAVTSWAYVHRGLEIAHELEARNVRWAQGFGGDQEYVRGFPAWYRLTVVRLPSEPGKRPPGAFYLDVFPPERVIGISEGNDLVHDYASPAAWHELGHALVSAHTGQIMDPPPFGHDAKAEEAVADLFALLVMERLDPNGDLPHEIGRGIERGFPDSIHRDVREGLVCHGRVLHPTPCDRIPGFGVYPPAGEPHAGSLVWSGFQHELWQLLVERYGRDVGTERWGDLLVQHLAFHRGQSLPPFGRSSVIELLLVSDSPVLGGDGIPQNGAPDADLIERAALHHNLWLLPFLRGDASSDGLLDISDALAILGALFLGRSGPTCLDAADANDDGSVEISDALGIIFHLFLDGPALPPPGACNELDPTPDDHLTCEAYPVCR